MDIYKIVLTSIILYSQIASVVTNTENNNLIYGPYKMELQNTSECEPMCSICTNEIRFFWSKLPSGVDEIVISGNFSTTYGPIGFELTAMAWYNMKYVPLVSLKTKNVCNLLMTVESRKILPMVNNRCFIPKGTYKYKYPDANNAIHVLIGNKLPYGKMKTKLILTRGKIFITCKEFYSQITQK